MIPSEKNTVCTRSVALHFAKQKKISRAETYIRELMGRWVDKGRKIWKQSSPTH